MDKRMDALAFALENEEKEREFYLAHARKTKNMAGKNMFKQIADEEKEHYEMLKKLHDKWAAQKKWPGDRSPESEEIGSRRRPEIHVRQKIRPDYRHGR